MFPFLKISIPVPRYSCYKLEAECVPGKKGGFVCREGVLGNVVGEAAALILASLSRAYEEGCAIYKYPRVDSLARSEG